MCAALAQAGGPVIVTTRFVVPSTNYTIHDAHGTSPPRSGEGKDSGGEGETGVRGREGAQWARARGIWLDVGLIKERGRRGALRMGRARHLSVRGTHKDTDRG